MEVKQQQAKPTLQINEPLNTPQLHPQGQMRIKAAAKMMGVHHQTPRRWWKAGKFPKPIDINGILLFRNADILKWLASRDLITDPNNATDSAQGA